VACSDVDKAAAASPPYVGPSCRIFPWRREERRLGAGEKRLSGRPTCGCPQFDPPAMIYSAPPCCRPASPPTRLCNKHGNEQTNLQNNIGHRTNSYGRCLRSVWRSGPGLNSYLSRGRVRGRQ
ncbi:Acetolactate synthase small subunit, mitochondrial, partial [Frankliniella fusca]